MSARNLGRGSMQVLVTDRTDELVRAAVDRVAPGAVDLIEDETRAIFDSARERWPVGPDKDYRPGHSRDALAWEVLIEGGTTIRGRVTNSAPWSKYIKPKGLRGRSAFVELLRKPLRARRKVIVQALGRFVVSTLDGV